MKKFIFFISSIFLLNSCMTAEQARIHYDNMSPMQLCMDYLTLPDLNIHQSDRAAAISRRGIDCRPYLNMAQQKSARDDAFMQALEQIQRMNTPNSYYSPYRGSNTGMTYFYSSSYVSGMNRICIYKLGSQVKTLTVGAAQLCPMSY
jgi:hypothetical protein